jgi:geranylgeranyl pyrophosphate synthase
MDGFIADAIRCLDVLPESPARQYLKALAQFVGDRKA